MIGSRIKALRESRRMNQAELAKLLGVANTTISQYETEKRSVDDASKIKIAEYFNVSVDYLLGRWDMQEKQIEENIKASDFSAIPVFKTISSISDLYDSNNVRAFGFIPRDFNKQGEYFGYKMNCDDMLDRIWPKDILVIRKQSILDSGDLGMILVGRNEAIVRKYELVNSGIILTTFNDIIKPVKYSFEEITALPVTIVGKVVASRCVF